MPSKAEPLVGLVWVADFDPTTAGGVAAPLWQFLIRIDTAQLYYKNGTANTAWISLSGGGGGGGITDVQEDGVDVVNPAATLNFLNDFDITDQGGGTAGVALKSSVTGDRVSFLYTATGAEGDSFIVGFPGAIERADLNYNVQLTMGDYTDLLQFAAPTSGFQLGGIQIDTSAPVAAGDQFMIDIVNRTTP